MAQIGIIVIGYNRKDSIERLLNRLNKCKYDSDSVPLIISIDNCGSNEVENCAKEFVWKYGKKHIHTYENRLGLKNHILKCGDFINEYELDAVVVFEDDVYPAEGFYRFVKQSVEYYAADDRVAGISLYAHQWNIHVDLPFHPYEEGNSDVYFMQVAQSWGQVWLKKQWGSFIDWYKEHEEFRPSLDVPKTYSGWPKSSWLKYHNQYCVEQKKYFVYPYQSLSTCFADAGEHAAFNSSVFQIPIEHNVEKQYRFVDLDDGMVYDAYFESLNVKRQLEASLDDEIIIDLYAQKPKTNVRYILSTASLPYKVVKSYGMALRPIESNVIEQIDGNDILLYDQQGKESSEQTDNSLKLWLYMQKQIPDWKTLYGLIRFKLQYRKNLLKKKKK